MTYDPINQIKYPFAMFWDTVEETFQYEAIRISKFKSEIDFRRVPHYAIQHKKYVKEW